MTRHKSRATAALEPLDSTPCSRRPRVRRRRRAAHHHPRPRHHVCRPDVDRERPTGRHDRRRRHSLGTLTWAAASAAGITAILVASQTAYDTLRIIGAAYLGYVGLRMLWRSRNSTQVLDDGGWAARRATSGGEAFRTGLLTNLLNPKVGVFYVTLLPQFIPAHAPVFAFSLLLASIHAVEGLLWFGVLTAATTRARQLLRRSTVKRWLDRATACVFLGFGARLALESSRIAPR